MQLRRGSLFGRVSQGLWEFCLWGFLQRVMGPPSSCAPPAHAIHIALTYAHPVLTTPTQLPILAVLLFSTLCLFLVAEAKDLYKVRGFKFVCAWGRRTSLSKQVQGDTLKPQVTHPLSSNPSFRADPGCQENRDGSRAEEAIPQGAFPCLSILGVCMRLACTYPPFLRYLLRSQLLRYFVFHLSIVPTFLLTPVPPTHRALPPSLPPLFPPLP